MTSTPTSVKILGSGCNFLGQLGIQNDTSDKNKLTEANQFPPSKLSNNSQFKISIEQSRGRFFIISIRTKSTNAIQEIFCNGHDYQEYRKCRQIDLSKLEQVISLATDYSTLYLATADNKAYSYRVHHKDPHNHPSLLFDFSATQYVIKKLNNYSYKVLYETTTGELLSVERNEITVVLKDVVETYTGGEFLIAKTKSGKFYKASGEVASPLSLPIPETSIRFIINAQSYLFILTHSNALSRLMQVGNDWKADREQTALPYNIVDMVCSHTPNVMLVTNTNELYSMGHNGNSECALGSSAEVETLTKVKLEIPPGMKIVKVTGGYASFYVQLGVDEMSTLFKNDRVHQQSKLFTAFGDVHVNF